MIQKFSPTPALVVLKSVRNEYTTMELPNSWSSYIVSALALFLGYACVLVFYRLFLHPLKDFPGPTIAAATLWYECYYDVVKGGQYVFEVEEMHKRYGRLKRPDQWTICLTSQAL